MSNDIASQLAASPEAKSWQTKAAVAAIPKMLLNGEKFCAMTSGAMGTGRWAVLCTDRRVLFVSKPLFRSLQQVEIPLSKINSIQHSAGFINSITVWDGASKVHLTAMYKDSVLPFVNAVNAAMQALQAPTRVASAVDAASQLEKLASLLEKGLLSKDEYESQKKKVLA